MPPDNTISAVQAGRWWDAIVVPQQRGLDALEVLDHETGRDPGPVAWDQNSMSPRLYFLVPLGTADGWRVAGTQALGETAYVGLPGWTTIEPPGLFWLCPPDPDGPDGLVDAGALRRALLLPLEGAA
jgi:hypothetical protein